MKSRCEPVWPLLVVSLMFLPVSASAQTLDTSRIRGAATRGYAAIQVAPKAARSSQTCTATCHLQTYGAFAYRAMLDRGLPLDDVVARADALRAFTRVGTNLSAAVEGNSLGETR